MTYSLSTTCPAVLIYKAVSLYLVPAKGSREEQESLKGTDFAKGTPFLPITSQHSQGTDGQSLTLQACDTDGRQSWMKIV